MDKALGNRIIALRQRIVANFNQGHWEEIGLLTGLSELITKYPRLLRSLYWNDEDYAGNVLGVLRRVAEEDPRALRAVEKYVEERFPGESEYVSAKPADRTITFAPHVFRVPDTGVEADLVAVMMPLRTEFDRVYKAIRLACKARA